MIPEEARDAAGEFDLAIDEAREVADAWCRFLDEGVAIAGETYRPAMLDEVIEEAAEGFAISLHLLGVRNPAALGVGVATLVIALKDRAPR